MENQETERACAEDGSQLIRNRSFKSKQLVRSQAIRESHSPPRAASPLVAETVKSNDKNNVTVVNVSVDNEARSVPSDESSGVDANREGQCCDEKQQIEIQISDGAWEEGADSPGVSVDLVSPSVSVDVVSPGVSDEAPPGGSGGGVCGGRGDLLCAPRVACVCGACKHTHCRGRRKQHQCPTKQDSGISCDREDGTDIELESMKKLSVDDEYTMTCRCSDNNKRDRRHTFVRHDSEDRSSLSGPELVRFMKETLNKNPRDRATLLRVERELYDLVHDTGRMVVRFPGMSSYGRLLVHRAAELFQLTHRLDPASRTGLIVSKTGTSGGQIPCTQFKQWCSAAFPEMPHNNNNNNNNSSNANTNAKFILKRATQSLEESGSGTFAANRSKSLEQREKDYERVRSRIFSEENCSAEDGQWPWLNSGAVKLLTPDAASRKLIKGHSLEVSPLAPGRGVVSKSHSFAGESSHRVLSRQGDLASSSWRLSPSSSGYKTLSLRSTDSVTPSPTGGASPEPGSGSNPGSLVWAVTDLARVPHGALVIHPQTGRPITNADGSLYHFDPAHPPAIYDHTYTSEQETELNNERRRGRLQKQHSFIDNECECQPTPTEEVSSKCCCECKQETTRSNADKPQPPAPAPAPAPHDPPQPPEPATKPTDTQKPHYEPTIDKLPYETITNQKQAYDKPANYREAGKISTNQRPLSYDHSANQKAYEVQGQRPSSGGRNKVNQEMQYVPQYVQYRNDELTSPQQMTLPPDMTSLAPQLTNKLAPTIIHDPNMRQMAVTNVLYPAPVPASYPYMNQYRPDQQVPGSMFAPAADTHKQLAHANDNNTFRIDPSYPFPAVDYSQCGPCTYVDPAYNRHAGYSGQFPGVDVSASYPAPVILPPTHYPYNDVQWGAPKLLVHDLYPYCGLVCPPMVPQQYQVCPPVYQTDKLAAGNRTRNTRNTPNSYNYDDRCVSAGSCAARPDYSQNGLLGGGPPTDDARLSSAARAIVNSIRSMQARGQPAFQPDSRNSSTRDRRRFDDKRTHRQDYRHEHTNYTQVPSANWCRGSPAPVYPVLNQPRRTHPSTRNDRR